MRKKNPLKADFVWFVLFTVTLLYFMLFGRNEGGSYEVNIIPLRSIVSEKILLVFIGNIGAFILLSVVLFRWTHCKLKGAFLLFFVCIVLIESLQYILNKGQFDVDDIILNCIGFALGYLIYLRTNKMQRFGKIINIVMSPLFHFLNLFYYISSHFFV